MSDDFLFAILCSVLRELDRNLALSNVVASASSSVNLWLLQFVRGVPLLWTVLVLCLKTAAAETVFFTFAGDIFSAGGPMLPRALSVGTLRSTAMLKGTDLRCQENRSRGLLQM
jgi:hypothetical protein